MPDETGEQDFPRAQLVWGEKRGIGFRNRTGSDSEANSQFDICAIAFIP
jgi:hypothetical protein